MAISKEHLTFTIDRLSHMLESISKKLDRNIISQIVLSFLAYLYLREPKVVESVLKALKLMDIPPELFQIAAPSALIYLFISWSYGSYQFIRVRKNLEDAYREYFGNSQENKIVKDSLDHEMFIPHSAFKYLYQANLSPNKWDRRVLYLALLPLVLVVSANTSISIFYAVHYLPSFLSPIIVPLIIGTYATFYVQFYKKTKDLKWYQEWVIILAVMNVLAGGNLIMFLSGLSQ